MKACAKCGIDIGTKDGENLCGDCEDGRRKDAARARRREREVALRSLGLTKVRGALGGVFWE